VFKALIQFRHVQSAVNAKLLLSGRQLYLNCPIVVAYSAAQPYAI
jgi:hypothetical protein